MDLKQFALNFQDDPSYMYEFLGALEELYPETYELLKSYIARRETGKKKAQEMAALLRANPS
jgi:hypothetical protein